MGSIDHHNALGDAITQAQAVQNCYKLVKEANLIVA